MSRRASLIALIVAVFALGAIGTACSSDGSSDASKKTKESTTTTVTFTGADSKKFCAQYQEFVTVNNSATLDPATVPVAELATRWAASVAALKAMESSASDEIKADVKLVSKTVADLQPALIAAGYDPAKVPQEERDRFQAAKARAASNRLTEYGTQVCEPEASK
jgi:ABC-type glycerol-3-phosphate transport system substrate-binding protein